MSGTPMEVLAPAGSPEALRAAVFAGADAVYLAGPAFGARAHARNFSREELKEAVEFCHGRGVAVHVTVNTLLKDRELPLALDFVEYLCALGVDAVLVQDMGLFALLRRAAPKLALHASTQMSLLDPPGVALLRDLGARRAVLARELSLREIREISEAAPGIELESFLHGALCMSVSGQCYLSAVLGGRSGNRGQCAQPCRLPFGAPGGTGHDLSLKDLSFISGVSALREAGVVSGKIEGRMKRPEYVAAATRAARLAADGLPVPEDLMQALRAVFSRSGFTDGYLTERRGREMFGTRTKEDVTGATGEVLGRLRALYRRELSRVPVRMTLALEADGLRLTAQDGEGHEAHAFAPMGEAALPRARALEQLKKTGGTPFFLTEAQVPETAPLSVSGLNALRREALTALLNQRAHRAPIPFSPVTLAFAPHPERPGPLPLRACFREAEQVPPEALACREIALPLETPLESLSALRNQGFSRILLILPRAAFGGAAAVRRRVETCIAAGFSEFIAGNLGHLPLGDLPGAALHGGFSLNITNTAALCFFERRGLKSAEVSFELSGRELRALSGALPRGIMLYGRQALMLIRNCPLANHPGGCRACRTPGALRDRTGRDFPVVCSGAGNARYAEVLNSVPLCLWDRPLPGADFGVLRFTVETRAECGAILTRARRMDPPEGDYTRGLFRSGVE